jgi:hypothetical protein
VRRVTAVLRRLPPTVILGAGWCAIVLYAYPGVMTMDSFDQLKEGRAWFFTDAHPPAMAALWGAIDRVVAGPIGMLLLQTGTFLAGLYLILRRAMRPRRAAIVACALALFPPVLAPMACVWKDCQMAGFLALGIAALLDDRRWVKIAGLGALTIATAMRYNALGATLPLVVLLLDLGIARGWRRYAIATGAWLGITAIALGGNALLVDRKTYFWYSSMALHDIVGTIAHVDDDLSDAELRAELAPTGILASDHLHDKIRAIYQPYDFQALLTGDRHLWELPAGFSEPAPEAQRDAIGAAWWDLITAHPGAYVEHRFAAFAEALGFSRRQVNQAVIPHRAQYAGMLQYMGLAAGYSSVQDALESANAWIARHTPLFRPHLYFLISIALLFACRRSRDVLAIVLSGLAMEMTLLPLVATPDYRYSHWLVVCACVGVALLIARRAREVVPA